MANRSAVGPPGPGGDNGPSALSNLTYGGDATPMARPALGRYEDEGELGQGGMGAVYRVRDPQLGRSVALKVARGDLSPERLARFVREARVTAQLQHPGIVAVHELGQLPDGRAYFTMKEIRGRELGELVAMVHEGGGEAGGWTQRRLVAALRDAAEAVAYAHSRGVVHRDLKPANIMVGDFGEVVVVDWGLAGLRGELSPEETGGQAAGEDRGGPGGRARSRAARPGADTLGPALTQAGVVQGTPAFMAPEQARGQNARVGPAADVFALGATLFLLLCGHPPYRGATVRETLARAARGERSPLEGALPIPDELRAVVEIAMAREPEDRYPDAGAFTTALASWLDGVRRHEDALAAVAAADALTAPIEDLRRRAAALRREATTLLDGVPPSAPVAEKVEAWRREDQADELDREALLATERRVDLLQVALRLEALLPEARSRLADHHRAEHEDAELRGDVGLAARAELRLRAYDDGRHAAWLAGEGTVTLHTDPPGARVSARPYELRDRRLVLGEERPLGETPLVGQRLPAGSWRLDVTLPGHLPLVYPVIIPRGGHWDGVPPGATEPEVIPLPREGSLGEGEDLVPAGWCWIGGDKDAPDSLPLSRVWVPGFVVRRAPVTVGEYLDWLNRLVAEGRGAEALARRPRPAADERGTTSPFQLDPRGQLVIVPDEDRQSWERSWPVTLITAEDGDAFAEDVSRRTGQAWRLLHDLEWEKAARGVDRRKFPWGDFFDPTWARSLHGQTTRAAPCGVGRYPVDAGPWGTADLAGLVRELCRSGYVRAHAFDLAGRRLDPLSRSVGELRVARGGTWSNGESFARSAARTAGPATGRWSVTGFRLARSV